MIIRFTYDPYSPAMPMFLGSFENALDFLAQYIQAEQEKQITPEAEMYVFYFTRVNRFGRFVEDHTPVYLPFRDSSQGGDLDHYLYEVIPTLTSENPVVKVRYKCAA